MSPHARCGKLDVTVAGRDEIVLTFEQAEDGVVTWPAPLPIPEETKPWPALSISMNDRTAFAVANLLLDALQAMNDAYGESEEHPEDVTE